MRAKRISSTISLAAPALTIGALIAPCFVEAAQRPRAHTKQEAKRNVLRVAPIVWKHSRTAELIVPHTGLLKTNVQVVCRGSGPRAGDAKIAASFA
ncbi:MAG: hypothetical protein M3P18_23320 [Actinomycetota bacterium]|nr:hypothetical protein [Actinomycetota bacterium]